MVEHFATLFRNFWRVGRLQFLLIHCFLQIFLPPKLKVDLIVHEFREFTRLIICIFLFLLVLSLSRKHLRFQNDFLFFLTFAFLPCRFIPNLLFVTMLSIMHKSLHAAWDSIFNSELFLLPLYINRTKSWLNIFFNC